MGGVEGKLGCAIVLMCEEVCTKVMVLIILCNFKTIVFLRVSGVWGGSEEMKSAFRSWKIRGRGRSNARKRLGKRRNPETP